MLERAERMPKTVTGRSIVFRSLAVKRWSVYRKDLKSDTGLVLYVSSLVIR